MLGPAGCAPVPQVREEQTISDTKVIYEYSPESFTGTELSTRLAW